jgi:type III pantothenate kinase
MLLAIDIGNSSTKFGIFDDDVLLKRLTVPTIRGKSAADINHTIESEISGPFSKIVISSVVPELRDAFTALGEDYFHRTPLFADVSMDFGLTLKYETPATLGIDRLVAAFAAREKYGAPLIVCDFGTATTIDAVSKSNEYLGGVITPGMNTLGEALFLKTSKLPRVELKRPDAVIGKNTIHSIQSGVFHGYLGLTEGIIKRMKAELEGRPKVIATGGFAQLIAENSTSINIVDETLMLDGLRRIGKATNIE